MKSEVTPQVNNSVELKSKGNQLKNFNQSFLAEIDEKRSLKRVI
jgi:hypothetical protein